MTACCASGAIVQETVQVSLGGTEYLTAATLYELTGVNISADSVTTCLMAAGTLPPVGWSAPDLMVEGSITVEAYLLLYPGDSALIDPSLGPASLLYFVSVQDLVSSSIGPVPGNYGWYLKLVDSSETIIRLIGEIQLT